MRALSQIRPFDQRDLDAAALAMNKAAHQAYAYFNWSYPVARTRELIDENREVWASVWVAEINGSVQGFMALENHFVDQIFVAPDWHGHGLGNLLMNKAKAIYPSHLELHCAQQNLPARRFYERHGFVAVEHRIYEKAGIGDIMYRWPGR
jgi:GNAT superfamily N-acetyltransferase